MFVGDRNIDKEANKSDNFEDNKICPFKHFECNFYIILQT